MTEPEEEVDVFLDELFNTPVRRRTKLPGEKKTGPVATAFGVLIASCAAGIIVTATILLIRLMIGAM